jgi:putative ABC transport system permease protein
MRALDRKLFRDLWHMRGMVFAISLVVLGGVSTFVMSLVTYESLLVTQQRYYVDQRFAEVFGNLVRAPESVAEQLAMLPGVNQVETRVVAPVNLEVSGFGDPITGRIVSLPEFGEPKLNKPLVRRGRLPQPGAETEVAVSEDFADAHGLEPGDRLAAVIRGRRQHVDIVGIALSPEYMYAIAPGAMFPDFKRYGILWMNRKALATAYDMDGAFNDVSFSLQRGAVAQDVIDRVDLVLARYGGFGAYAREDQFSHRFISEELRGLETMATLFPVIFLGVAAFLLNVVMGRLVATEREQIATLKAFGYSSTQVGLHYAKLVLLITSLGLAIGVALGARFARGLSSIYQEFYSFPFLDFRLDPVIVLQAVLVTVGAALGGTAWAVRRAARLPPAEGMRAEPPPAYHATFLERLGLQQRLAEPSRMIVRHLSRQPFKAALSMAGIAAACGILMITNFQRDAIGWMMGVQFGLGSREDLAVTFTDPTPRRALYSLEGLEGVTHAEGHRVVAARLVHGHRSHRGSIEGVEPDSTLHRVLDASLQPLQVPAEGLVLTDYLAQEILQIEPGEVLRVEVLEGARPVLEIPVVAVAQQYLGVNAYMQRETLNRLMREGPAITGARLAVDAELEPAVYKRLREMPRVAGTVVRENAIRQFDEMMEETILYFSFITALLGGFIAFGVVYNSMRIALSERGRELASLRVLGFTRLEVAYILLGEIGLLTLAAIPFGYAFGWGLSAYLALAFSSDLYRIELVISPGTYALAAAVVLVSFLISSLLAWRKLDRLDLVEVLKTRE